MSAFAALAGFDGGDDDIMKQHQKRQAEEREQRERDVAASQRAFADLKSKAGQSNWADDSDEDDDGFLDLPVRYRAGLGQPAPAASPFSTLLQCIASIPCRRARLHHGWECSSVVCLRCDSSAA